MEYQISETDATAYMLQWLEGRVAHQTALNSIQNGTTGFTLFKLFSVHYEDTWLSCDHLYGKPRVDVPCCELKYPAN